MLGNYGNESNRRNENKKHQKTKQKRIQTTDSSTEQNIAILLTHKKSNDSSSCGSTNAHPRSLRSYCRTSGRTEKFWDASENGTHMFLVEIRCQGLLRSLNEWRRQKTSTFIIYRKEPINDQGRISNIAAQFQFQGQSSTAVVTGYSFMWSSGNSVSCFCPYMSFQHKKPISLSLT